MPKLSNSAFKYITPAKAFSLPKLPQGKPVSGGQASRETASGYGKVSERGSGPTPVPSQKGLRN